MFMYVAKKRRLSAAIVVVMPVLHTDLSQQVSQVGLQAADADTLLLQLTLLSSFVFLSAPSVLSWPATIFFGLTRTARAALPSSAPPYWYVGGDCAPPVTPIPLPSLITSNVFGK